MMKHVVQQLLSGNQRTLTLAEAAVTRERPRRPAWYVDSARLHTLAYVVLTGVHSPMGATVVRSSAPKRIPRDDGAALLVLGNLGLLRH
jgi:hypothetical protein